MGQRGTFERGLPRAHAGRLCDLHVNLWRRLGELVTPDAEREQASDQLSGALADTAAACRSVADQWSAGTLEPRDRCQRQRGGAGRDQPVPRG